VADRVAVMRAGRIVQAGLLEEIRARPADEWVAGFVGHAAAGR
jgi:ABC-type Fe3+/spermidine/putrescine transport system ATPase subunit